jgi:hypothetical protein
VATEKSQECWGCRELSISMSNVYIVHTQHQNYRGYITVTKITIEHINTAHQWLDLYLKYNGCLIDFSHNITQFLLDMLPPNKSQIFTCSLQVSTLHALLAWEDYCNFYLAFEASFAMGEADFHKTKAEKHQQIIR